MKNQSKKIVLSIMVVMIIAVMTITAGNILLVNSAENKTEKLADYIGFYVENPKCFVNGAERYISNSNKKLAPTSDAPPPNASFIMTTPITVMSAQFILSH